MRGYCPSFTTCHISNGPRQSRRTPLRETHQCNATIIGIMGMRPTRKNPRGRLIKAGHLRRYIREVNSEEESAPTIGRITTSVAASPESRPAINYILGGPLDDQYQSKCQQKKLLRAATNKAWVNAVHTSGS